MGANDLVVLFRIVIPLSTAVIAVVALFTAVGHWNNWFSALIYLKSSTKYPLQLVLREILVEKSMLSMTTQLAADAADLYNRLIEYCTIMVATLPILFAYPFVQRYFVKGVMIGSIKG